MLTVKFDNQIALTQASANREETPFLRGTVVIAAAGFESLLHARVKVFADRNPEALEYTGKWAEIEASLTGRVETDAGKSSFTLDDVSVIKYLGEKEAKQLRTALSQAQLAQLMAAQPTRISGTATRAASGVAPVQTADQLAAAGDI